MSSNAELRKWLVERNVFPEALEWLGDRDIATAWAECPNPKWMMFVLRRSKMQEKDFVRIACKIVRDLTWDHLDYRSRDGVIAAEQWVTGEKTRSDLHKYIAQSVDSFHEQPRGTLNSMRAWAALCCVCNHAPSDGSLRDVIDTLSDASRDYPAAMCKVISSLIPYSEIEEFIPC
jgi:hypothetical protein